MSKNLKLVILGATGKVGTELVSQATERGHQVTALVRHPESLANDKVKVLQGDALNIEDVSNAVKGADAIISVLGHKKDSPADLLELTAHTIVTAAKKHNVNRVIVLTGAVVRDEQDKPKLSDKLFRWSLSIFAGKLLKDVNALSDVISESGLDWTIVRATQMTDGPKTGKYKVGYLGNASMKISRADLADFILNETEESNWAQKKPVVSY